MKRYATVGALALAMIASSAQTEPAALRAASFVPDGAIVGKHFRQWVEEVNQQCAEHVEIDVVGPSAIPSLQQWNAMRTGVVDIYYGPTNYYKGALPEADVTILAENTPVEWRENGALDLINKLHNERMNAWYLTTLLNGLDFYIYTSEPIESGSFEGVRLRSTPAYDDFFDALGAQKVQLGAPELYTALERGTVEGFGWPVWGVSDFGWDQVVNYRHGPGFFNANTVVLVNLDRWNGFSDAQRDCLTEMAIWLEGEWPAWRDAETERQLALQEEAGVTYVDLGPDFPATAHELHWKSIERFNPELAEEIRPLLQSD